MTKKSRIGDQKGSKSSILQVLRMHGSMSRIRLAKLTGLSRAGISMAVAELLEASLIHETEIQQSTGGRRAVTLEIAPNAYAVFGADYANQEWILGAFDLLGNSLITVRVPVTDPSPEAAISSLAAEIKKLISNIEIVPIPLLGLGMPGLVDSELGIIHSAAGFGWYNVNVQKMIEKELGWPTVILNRQRARGLAEYRYGSGRELNQMIFVGIDSGIAAALFHNQQLIAGAMGGAGELGHITIEPDGPLCHCGNHGCLQLLSAGPAIEREFRKLLRSGESSILYPDPAFDLQLLKATDICRAADQGDQTAMQVVHKAATYLGIALATIANLFNPEGIILGGPISKASEFYVETAVKVMQQRAMGPLISKVVVKTASINEMGGALGAANYALDKHMSYSILMNRN